MNRTRLRELWVRHRTALGVAALATVAALAGSLLAVGRTPSFAVDSGASVLLSLMPDIVVTAGIGTLRDLAQPLLAAGATALLLLGGTALVFGLGRALARAWGSASAGAHAAVALFTLTPLAYLLTNNAASALGAGLAAALTLLATTAIFEPSGTVEGRRRLLRAGAVAVSTVGLGALFRRGGGETTQEPVAPAAASLLADADALGFDLPDTEPMVSEAFYKVDIGTADPVISPEDWSLSVTGLVEQEHEFTLPELQDEFDAERRFVTLRCVSDLINGTKMDTALWTGVTVADILDAVGAPESCCVTLHAADDYYVSFPREALDPGLLAWGMNGRSLPRGHGFPLRTLVPGHWGETNAKWLTEIEIREEPEDGYWEERGWRGTGEVHTVAKLHGVDRSGERIRVGGHAYAGKRGISAVEISTDGGETWTDATLSEPLPGSTPVEAGEEAPQPDGEAMDAWQMWEHEYSADSRHEVVVRAIDGTGTVQPREQQDSYPEGATGWVRKSINA